jgi:hypothetical protein
MFWGVREVKDRACKGEEELNPTQNWPRCRGPRLSSSADIPGRVSHVRHNQADTTENRIDRHNIQPDNKMPDNVVESPYPLVDADPHFSRVMRYMRPSDYAVWAGATAAFPSALYFWGM